MQLEQARAAMKEQGLEHDPSLLPQPETEFDPTEDDAFSTLMQWLYWKIPDVKAQQPARRRSQ